jgi:hypothetical protein
VDLVAQGDRARKLKNLTGHEGWAELKAMYGEERAAYVERTAARLLRRDHKFDQREADFRAGYFTAWDTILNEPEKAGRRIEAKLRRQEESR